MSTVRKCLLVELFSYEQHKHAIELNEETKVYVSSSLHPLKTKLVYGNKSKSSNQPAGIVTCHDYQTLEWIKQLSAELPKQTWSLLLNGFTHINLKTLYVVLNPRNYVSRSVTINMNWCKRLWSLETRAHMISVTGVYYSVLGGAYCSLGKSNTKYAYKAGALAIEQIKLARRLKDNILECKCWLYYAEDLIQLGKLTKAHKIITQQTEFIKQSDNSTLSSMLDAVIGKLDIASKSKIE